MDVDSAHFWRKCSSCKKPISYKSKYFICSTSTCNNARTGYVFCSVACFEVHVPGARHKDAAAIEQTSPDREPRQKIIPSKSSTSPNLSSPSISREVLIIASRLKEYIAARSEMNTSAQVMDVLSDHVRSLCDRAIDSARADGRKTVLDRDFSFLKSNK